MKQTSKPLPRLPPRKKKKAKRLEIEAAAIARGTELGKSQAHKRKSFIESAREHLGHWLDNIDPLELLAVVGMTYIVHEVINKTDELAQALEHYTGLTPYGINVPAVGSILERAYRSSETGVFPWQAEFWAEGTTNPQVSGPENSWQSWLISFTVAFMLVKYGGTIVGGLTGGLAAAIKIFMPTGTS